MAQLNLGLASKFVAQCEKLGATGPASIARAVEILATAKAFESEPPRPPLFNMTADQVRAHITEMSVRMHKSTNGQGLTPGLVEFTTRLTDETREEALPELEALTEQLRPRFQELSAPLTIAARDYGFTLQTSSDEVINLADERASGAWRDAKAAWRAISPIVDLRTRMVDLFTLRPSRKDMESASARIRTDIPLNYSVLFAAGDNWGLGQDYMATDSGSLDWFALAAGGLRLNSPNEVAEKIEARKQAKRQEFAAQHAASATQQPDAALQPTS